jgi:hypothetical protein
MNIYNETNFTNKLLAKIPLDIKPLVYLSETLEISKESARRRLHGKIPFTFEDMLKLSARLNFSIDELLKEEKSQYAFFGLYNKSLFNEENSFLHMYKIFNKQTEENSKVKDNQITLSANRITSIVSSSFPYLFKFYYYKWIYQFMDTSLNFKYSDVQIPEELDKLRQQTIEYNAKQNVTFITDKNFMFNTVREIKYYIDRGLIDDEDILLIKNDLTNFIDYYFSFSDNSFGSETIYDVYISSLNIESSISHAVYGDTILSTIWTYGDSGIYTLDPELCKLQKHWLDSLKKYSILISGSNEKMQAELYNLFLSQLEMLTTKE